MKLTITLFSVAVACFLVAACTSAEQAVTGTALAIGAAGEFIAALSPILEPEQLAKLQAAAGKIDGTVQATQSAVSVIADAIAAFKNSVGANNAATAAALQQQAQQLAAAPSMSDVYLVGGGAGAGGTAASRLLSHFKHAKKA